MDPKQLAGDLRKLADELDATPTHAAFGGNLVNIITQIMSIVKLIQQYWPIIQQVLDLLKQLQPPTSAPGTPPVPAPTPTPTASPWGTP